MDADRPPEEPIAPPAPDSGAEWDEAADADIPSAAGDPTEPAPPPSDAPSRSEADADDDSDADATEEDADEDTVTAVPAVVAIVVARGSALHLEACLTGLAGQDYPDLTVLVVAATVDDIRERVAAVLPTAYVRAAAPSTISVAANEALATVAGAPFLFMVHDDTVCEPTAVRLLVEEAYRSNAAILGPKVVDVERPELLREVGWSVDRLGVPHTEIEQDELDQEQHDAVRDVFFVSDAAMLVRADLFSELNGFDPAADAGARALDLCWRARLAGARVLVVPDARVRHHEADGEEDELAVAQSRVRAMLVNTGGARLAWIAPVSFVVHVVEALVLLLRRRRVRARVALGAWTANLRNLGALRTARAAAQARRVVSDGEIHAFQFRGSARVSAYLADSLHAEDRMRAISARGRSVADSANTRFRTARGIVVLVVLAVALIGTRDLLLGRVAAVGDLLPWPSTGDLWRAFTSEWRFADLGAQSPAPAAFGVSVLARILTLGRPGLAPALMLVVAIPVAMGGAHRLAARTAAPGWPATVAAITYGVLPLVRNAIEHGRVGAVALYMLAPWIALGVWQVSGLVPHRWPHRRLVALTGLAVAVTAAWWPLAVLFPLLLATGVFVSTCFGAQSWRSTQRVGTSAGLVALVGVSLLVPWPITWAVGHDHLGALGITGSVHDSFTELFRFFTGANGAGLAGWTFLIAALGATSLVSGERAVWCARWWGVALSAWVLAAVPYWLDTPTPAPEAVLVGAALALAMIIGSGLAAFLEDVRTRGLGWQQLVAVGSGVLLILGALGFVGDAAGGRFHQPASDWASELSWMRAQRDLGPFRVLWLGAPNTVPGSVHRSGPVGFALTQNGPGDLRDVLAPGGGSGLATLRDAVTQLDDGATERFGRLLGPMAVRYIVVLNRPDPGLARPDPVAERIDQSLTRQLDLRSVAGQTGARVYDNAAWIPGDAVLTTLPPRPIRGDDLLAVRANRATSGTALWSQQFSEAWTARQGGRVLRHQEVAGWTNGFAVRRGVPDAIEFDRQWWRWIALAVQVAIIGFWARRVLRRGRRRRGGTGSPVGVAREPAGSGSPATDQIEGPA